MKCKSWSNKFNDFVVRRMKSLKLNGQQQVLSTMPAMPKEKSPVSISESPYTDIININMTAVSTTYLGTKVPTTNELCDNTSVPSLNNSSTVTAAPTSLTPSVPQQQQQCNTDHHNGVMTSNDTTTTGSCRYSFLSNKIAVTPTIERRRITSMAPRPLSGRSSIIDVSSSSPSSSNASSITSSTSVAPMSVSHIKSRIIVPSATAAATTTTSTSPPKTATSATATAGAKTVSASNRPNQPVPKKSANDFVFGKYIGEGSYSTVFLARDVHTSKEYAIKVCDKQHIIRERKQEYIRREREVMHIMNNVPGFVNLSCTFQDARSLYFVMTYAKNSDLLPYINRVGSFDMECTCHYAAELVLAIEQMHKRGVIHRDLKPENILLDENMHTLIADFGSAKILADSSSTSAASPATTATCAGEANNSANTRGAGEWTPMSAPQQPPRRRGSFVGTAQYVSPEVLQGRETTKAADLWALGCIIYQMTAGLPPFRGSSDYLIFREIMNLNLVFPEGFDKNAEDLVRQLLRLDADERIGAQDKEGRYESIRTHPFFENINWDTLRKQTPPTIYPYLPGVHKEEDLKSNYFVPHDLEPGLDDCQLSRLLGLELGTAVVTPSIERSNKQKQKKTEYKNKFNLSEAEKVHRLELQQSDQWNRFCDGEVILKKGFVNKRKGLFARKRMLLLTTGPRLIYVDPVHMVKKGEIPWSADLKVEFKNFKIFFVHTPNRTYYLEDPEGYAMDWAKEIDHVRECVYGKEESTTTSSSQNDNSSH